MHRPLGPYPLVYLVRLHWPGPEDLEEAYQDSPPWHLRAHDPRVSIIMYVTKLSHTINEEGVEIRVGPNTGLINTI